MSRSIKPGSNIGFKKALILGGIGSILVMVSLPAAAQDNPPVEELPPIEVEGEIEELPPIEVEGEIEELVEGKDVPTQADRVESVTIINRETIEKNRAVSVYDTFKKTPGVNVGQGHAIGFGAGNRSGGPMTIRGIGRTFGTNRTRGILTTIDGVPDISITHGHPFADLPTLENVERIEIIKGPSTVLDGGGAMAGLIKITTIDPAPDWHSFAQTSAGSFATNENSARVSYGGENGFFLASGNYRRSDGHRSNTQFEAGAAQVKLGHDLGENFKLTLGGGGGSFNFENPAPVGGSPPNNRTGKVDHFNANIGLTGKFANSETSVKFYVLDVDLEFNDGTTTEPNKLYGVKLKETLNLFEGNTLILGFDWLMYSLARNDTMPEAVSEYAPYLFVEQELLDNLKVNAGFRVSENEQFGGNVSAEGGLVFKPFAGTSLRGRIAEGYRPPSIIETGTDRRANEDLRPIEMVQYEVGINQQFGGWVDLDIVVFLQEGNNIVRLEPAPGGGTQFGNSGVFSHQGIEAQAKIHLSDSLELFAAATILDVGEDTALVPQHTYDFGASFKKGQFGVDLTGRHVSHLYNSDNHQNRLGDYTVIDLSLNYYCGDNYRFFVDIDNIADESYEVVQNFPLPGISAYAGLSVNF